jgi:phage terminase large subunit-like protein
VTAVTPEGLRAKIERLERLRSLEIAKATNKPVWELMPHQRVPDGSWYLWLLLAGRGAGKALSLDTPLPTPSGWTTMGEVEVGDELIDECGLACRVTFATGVMTDRPCYRVSFSDGSSVVADADHRWLVWPHAYRKALGRRVGGGDPRRPQCRPSVTPRVMTTAEMVEELRHGTRGDRNLAVPVAAPLQLPDADLPVDPYVLGVWLGDGHRHAAAVTTMETEVVAGIEEAGYELTARPYGNSGRATTYGVRATDRTKSGSLHRQLRLLGLLHGTKRIPAPYLRASADQRFRLLQGLMDSDGTVAPNGACEFLVTEKPLADGFAELVVTLGWKATRSTRSVDGRPAYRVRFNPHVPVATVARKATRVRRDVAQGQRHSHRMVVAVEPVDSVPVRCVQVDSPSHLYLAGRAMIPTHNTDACAYYFDRYMRHHPGHRGGIVAPTLGDAAEACVYGPSGLMAHNPLVRLRSRAGGTHVVWPNGSEAKLFGAYTREDVERLRAGGNRHLYWAEELAAWRYLKEAWENMELGLRLGVNPHIVGSTTPKPRPKMRELMGAAETILVRASMYDNPHLPVLQRERLRAKYEGTRIGAQELLGEYLEDVEGALWTYETLALCRVPEAPETLTRVVVAVDPSGGDEDGNDEQGIVVAGRGPDGHGYILADRSCKLSPGGWGKRAVQAYLDFKADVIVGESNFGGDLVTSNVRMAARDMGVEVNVKKISASRGKVARAEPIAALYEQKRAHHVGPPDDYLELEGQQLRWTPDSGWSPDRMDAAVWALTELHLDRQPARAARSAVARGRIPGVDAVRR